MISNCPLKGFFAIPREVLKQKVWKFIADDLIHGDLSSSFIPPDATAKAKIIAKSSGIIAGLEEAQLIFEESGLITSSDFQDGDDIQKSQILMTISGKIRDILMVERTALNFLMRMSSIASSTDDFVKKIKSVNSHVKLAATRKVTPGFGWFEKKAVYYGGGDPHRWNLGDMVMFKDTHRTFFKNDLARLLECAKENISFSKKIELEIEDIADLAIAIEKKVDIIMLDNMNPQKIKNALKDYHEISHGVLLEASGNITLENVQDFAQSGVDIISTSATILRPHLTMDFSLRL